MTAEPIRHAALRSLCAALEIHAQVEEEFFYPAMRQFGVNSTDLPALSKSPEEHEHMRELIKSVRSLQVQRRAQDASVAKPVNAVMHHVADEETQPLPLAERELEKERLAELGAQTTARKLELSRPRAAELATDMSAASPVEATMGRGRAGSGFNLPGQPAQNTKFGTMSSLRVRPLPQLTGWRAIRASSFNNSL